jgi:hypothetical protein
VKERMEGRKEEKKGRRRKREREITYHGNICSSVNLLFSK